MILVSRGRTVALRRYHRHQALRCEVRSDLITVIRFVHDGMRQLRCLRHLGQYGLQDGALMPLPLGEHQSDTGVFAYTASMDFGGQAASRAAQSLCGLPAVFCNAPAAG
jgi:hypothetical protein